MIGPSIPCHPRCRIHQGPHDLGASAVPVAGPGLRVESLGFVLDLEDGLRWGCQTPGDMLVYIYIYICIYIYTYVSYCHPAGNMEMIAMKIEVPQ